MTVPAFWVWLLVVALSCVTFWAVWLWAAVVFWKENSRRLRKVIERDRLMYAAGAKPRETIAHGDPRYVDPQTFAALVKLGRVRLDDGNA